MPAQKAAKAGSFESDPAHTRQLLASIVESSDDAILNENLEGVITHWDAGVLRQGPA